MKCVKSYHCSARPTGGTGSPRPSPTGRGSPVAADAGFLSSWDGTSGRCSDCVTPVIEGTGDRAF